MSIASAASSLITLGLFRLYGHVHWNILFRNYQDMSEAERHKWLTILSGLDIYRLVGLVALILAAVALTRRPRWPVLIYGPLAIIAGWVSLIIM